jgi:hypothetical protein
MGARYRGRSMLRELIQLALVRTAAASDLMS